MNKKSYSSYLLPAALVFVGLPLLLWAAGDFPRRSALKEFLSVLTLLSLSLMLGQFYLARINPGAVNAFGPVRLVLFHKIIGYTVLAVLLAHPFLVVLPRYFEAGIDPLEAFVTLITAFDSLGVLLGMAAWCLMIILGFTSLFRDRLPMKYKTWMILHGVLSALFIAVAIWHAVELGRYTNVAISSILTALAVGGVALLLRSYIAKSTEKEHSHE